MMLRIKSLMLVIFMVSSGVMAENRSIPVGGYALQFQDGDFVTIPYSEDCNPNRLTIESWVKFQLKNNVQLVIGNGGFQLSASHTGQGTVLSFGMGTYSVSFISPDLSTDQWFHMAGVYDGSSIRIVVNGITVAEKMVGSPGVTAPKPFLFQCSGFGAVVDEVHLWSIARTERDIRSTMTLELNRAPSLVASWHFNEGRGVRVHDSSGGHDGYLGNSPENGENNPDWLIYGSVRTPVAQPLPASFALSIPDKGYVSIAHHDSLNPNSITVECRVRFHDLAASPQSFITKGSQGLGGYDLSLVNGNAVSFMVGRAWARVTSDSLHLAPETWYHVAAVYDGNRMRVLLNGQTVGEEQIGPVDHKTTDPLFFNRYYGYHSPMQRAYADLDEVRIWSTARTDEEIRETMNRELNRGALLVGSWHFNERLGAVAYDSAGGHTGIFSDVDSPSRVESEVFRTLQKITAPTGGDILECGIPYDIRWEGNSKRLRLEYSIDNGDSWTVIGENIDAATGAYTWTPPDTESSAALIRITDEFGYISITSIPFALSNPFIQVYTPNGGEEAASGYPFPVSWASPGVRNVRIEYSTDAGNSWNIATASIPADSGSYSWIPPEVESSYCLLRVSDTDHPEITDSTDAVLAVGKPYLTLTAPSGGEIWETNTVHAIQWMSFGVETVDVSCQFGSGGRWNSVARGKESSTGSVDWRIPFTESANCRVLVSSVEKPELAAQSEIPFTTVMSVLKLLAPKGGETLEAGAPFDVIWEATPGADSVRIDFSPDNGASWKRIGTSYTALQSRRVHLPLEESSRCLLRISLKDNENIISQTGNTFSIIPSASNPWTWKNISETVAVNGLAAKGPYIWCATPDGLVRWDTRTLDSKRFDGPSNGFINAIVAGSDGSVWMATPTNVVRFDGKRYTLFTREDGLPSDAIGFLAAGSDGAVWTGAQHIFSDMYSTTKNWITHFDGAGWKDVFYRYRERGFDVMTSIAVHTETDAWAVIAGRLNHFDGAAWIDSVVVEGMEGERLGLAACDSNGDLWVTGGSGIARGSGGKWKVETFPGCSFSALTAGPGNRAGVGYTDSLDVRGVAVFDGTDWKTYPLGTGNGYAVNALVFDSEGGLWTGTPGGLYRLENGAWTEYSASTGIPVDAGKILGTDQSGNPVISLPNGFAVQNGASWTKYPYPASVDTVKATVIASDGLVWVGALNGLYRFDWESWTRFTPAEGLPDSTVTGIYPGLDGILRVKTTGGFCTVNGKTISPLRFPMEGLGDRSIRELDVTPNGETWAILEGKGHPVPARLGRDRWTIFDLIPRSGNGWLDTFLFMGKDGAIWAAISLADYGNGNYYWGEIYSFTGSGWNPKFAASGILSSIIIDPWNTIWLGSGSYGFYSPSGYAVSGGGLVKYEGSITWYSASGTGWGYVPEDFFLFESVNSECVLPDSRVSSLALAPNGTLWVRTETGLTRFGRVVATDVNQIAGLPKELTIRGNYPNPFNPSTTISFTLPAENAAELAIFSITGQKIRTLADGRLSPGDHTAIWDGRDDRGAMVSSGVYISRLESGKSVRTARMLLLK